jgi:tetratricopeptide (TPR) repeat protein
VNPSKLDRNRQMDVCMQCHLETTSQSLPNSVVKRDRSVFSFRPGERLQDYAAYFDFPDAKKRDDFNIVHQAYRLLQSQCFQQSDMTCVTCHDPHKSSRNQESRFNETCANCHRNVAAHGENCTACHMPQRRTDDVVHVVMTDHWIQRRPPNGILAAKAEPQSMPYRGSLAFYFPEADNRYLGVALARGADVRRGITIMEGTTPRPNFELAAAYASIGDHEKAAREYDAGLKSDPAYAEGWYNLGLSLLALRRDRDSRTAFESALQRKPLADAHVGLALLATRANDFAGARQSYKRALELDPMNVTALTNLALIERAAGNTSAANEYLQQTLRIHPK